MNTNAATLNDMAVRAENTNDKAEILAAFEPVFHDVRAKRDELITRVVVLTYRATWKRKAWKARGYKSANTMFRALLGFEVKGKLTKDQKELVKAEVNFSHYVRNNSPAALALSGKKRGGKASKMSLESFQAYVDKATAALAVTGETANERAAVNAIVDAVLLWAAPSVAAEAKLAA